MTDLSGDKEAWLTHRREAIKKFLINAVIIDNEPVLQSKVSNETSSRSPEAIATADEEDFAGTGKVNERLDEPRQDPPAPPSTSADASSELNIRLAADSFADQGISCSFLLPDDSSQDEAKIKTRTLKMAGPADLVVIDWYLKGSSSSLTKQILSDLIRNDLKEQGRLRLICIYTNQNDVGDIVDECKKALEQAGLKDPNTNPDEGTLTANNFHLVVYIKKEVTVTDLPNKLIDAFSIFADGILPAFALSAVAAIRRNVHHIITQFSKDLDAAYVANRLISDPPGDVAELMRDLFASECDAALGLECVADQCLEKNVINWWLTDQDQPLNAELKVNEDNNQKIDRQFLGALLAGKLNLQGDGTVDLREGTDISFKESRRKRVAQSLHAEAGEEKATERKFARLVVLKREAFGRSKLNPDSDWKPTLTLGTLLAKLGEDQKVEAYLYCLTPACDTVRLQGKGRDFQFLPLEQNNKKPSLIIMSPEKVELKLRAEFHSKHITKHEFQGDPVLGRVFAEREKHEQSTRYFFTSSSDRFLWLGEVRTDRAQRDLTEFTNKYLFEFTEFLSQFRKQWMRSGIIDSEYLRLAGRNNGLL